MANEIVFTDVFRLSYPHLEKPQEPQNAGEAAKYGIAMMFPQSGVLPVNNQPSTTDSIFAALDKCCMEQWNINFAQASAEGMGVQFPPKRKDGNTVFEKDAQGNPIAGQVSPNSANMWILTAKNIDPVGCCDPTGTIDIAPKDVLAGYWCSAELECAAYDSKNGRVISIKVLNVQLCYKDEVFGNKRVATPASASFANRAIADSNIAQGSIQRVVPNQVTPSAPSVPTPPAPTVPTPPAPTPTTPVIMNEGQPTYEAMIANGWTDEQIITAGYGKANYMDPAG